MPGLLATALLTIAAVGTAALLRSARCPGWPVAGGILAGVLIGPSVLGRVQPVAYEDLFSGGRDERTVVEEVRSRAGAEMFAAASAGLGPEARRDVERRHAPRIESAETAWDQARWDDQRPLRIFTLVIAGLVLAAAGPLGTRDHSPPVDRLSAASIGLWSSVIPGGLTVVFVRLAGAEIAEALLVGAAVAAGPWLLSTADRSAAEDVEPGGAALIRSAGRVASIVALAAAGAALLARDAADLVYLVPLATLPFGWALGPRGLRGPHSRRLIDAATRWVLLPTLAAAVATRIELRTHFAFWTIVVVAVLGGDGRWIGACIGAVTIGGRRGLRIMRLGLGSMAAGPTQLAFTAVALCSWSIAERHAYALLVGVLLIETTAGMRRALAARLAEAEDGVTPP